MIYNYQPMDVITYPCPKFDVGLAVAKRGPIYRWLSASLSDVVLPMAELVSVSHYCLRCTSIQISFGRYLRIYSQHSEWDLYCQLVTWIKTSWTRTSSYPIHVGWRCRDRFHQWQRSIQLKSMLLFAKLLVTASCRASKALHFSFMVTELD